MSSVLTYLRSPAAPMSRLAQIGLLIATAVAFFAAGWEGREAYFRRQFQPFTENAAKANDAYMRSVEERSRR